RIQPIVEMHLERIRIGVYRVAERLCERVRGGAPGTELVSAIAVPLQSRRREDSVYGGIRIKPSVEICLSVRIWFDVRVDGEVGARHIGASWVRDDGARWAKRQEVVPHLRLNSFVSLAHHLLKRAPLVVVE